MRIVRNPDVLWREEDEARAEADDALAQGRDATDLGTSVLFADGIMLSLNILGTEIWKRCDGRGLDDIVTDLASLFDADPEVIRRDAQEFLSELAQKDFIRYEDR